MALSKNFSDRILHQKDVLLLYVKKVKFMSVRDVATGSLR